MNILAIFRNAKSKPITPIKPVNGWKQVPIEECGEKLVPLGPFLAPSDPGFSDRIFQDAVYWGERTSSPYKNGELDGALITPFVREGVAKKLAKAASYLPRGYGLLIWDSYRPLSVQKALYDDYYNQLIEKKGMEPEEATKEAQRFVSIPSTDLTKPSPHNTGASIDLTIIKFAPEVLAELDDLNKKLKSKNEDEQYKAEMRRMQIVREHSVVLNMGTEFDAVLPQTATRFYEEKAEVGEKLNPSETEALTNRRLLVDVMQRVGLSNYGEEWWHFDGGNQFDAVRAGKTAIYSAADFSDECKAWEKMRVDHFWGSLRWRNASPETKLGNTPLVELVRSTAQRTGDSKISHHQKAMRLEV